MFNKSFIFRLPVVIILLTAIKSNGFFWGYSAKDRLTHIKEHIQFLENKISENQKDIELSKEAGINEINQYFMLCRAKPEECAKNSALNIINKTLDLVVNRHPDIKDLHNTLKKLKAIRDRIENPVKNQTKKSTDDTTQSNLSTTSTQSTTNQQPG